MQPVPDDFPMVPSDDIRLITACALEQNKLVVFWSVPHNMQRYNVFLSTHTTIF